MSQELLTKQAAEEAEGKGVWVAVEKRLPTPADYVCKVDRPAVFGDGEDAAGIIRVKRLRGTTWFGGMRPFSSHDVVTHWWESSDATL